MTTSTSFLSTVSPSPARISLTVPPAWARSSFSHLHGFDDDHTLAGFHRVAHRYGNRHDAAGHGRLDLFAPGAAAGLDLAAQPGQLLVLHGYHGRNAVDPDLPLLAPGRRHRRVGPAFDEHGIELIPLDRDHVDFHRLAVDTQRDPAVPFIQADGVGRALYGDEIAQCAPFRRLVYRAACVGQAVTGPFGGWAGVIGPFAWRRDGQSASTDSLRIRRIPPRRHRPAPPVSLPGVS